MKFKITGYILIISLFISLTAIVKANYINIDLLGYTIYVDAGHGGKDDGANYNNIVEDDINLRISKELISILVDSGAQVYTSRDGDYDLASNYDKNRKAKDLKKRVELINTINPDLFISIHLNTYSDDKVYGGQVFFQENENSKDLSDILQNKLNSISQTGKKSKKGDYYLLNNTLPVGVIVECGFLTNPEDLKKLVTNTYQNKIAKLISEGIFEYFNLEK